MSIIDNREVVDIVVEVNYQEKGDKGDRGDPFTYEDFTPEEIEELQQPALDAAIIANQAAIDADNAANRANTAAEDTEEATQDAITATENANQAAENVPVIGTIDPADPEPEKNGMYIPEVTQNESGTPIVYTNAGGLTVNTAEGGEDYGKAPQLIKNGAVWVKSSYPLPGGGVVKKLTDLENDTPINTLPNGGDILSNVYRDVFTDIVEGHYRFKGNRVVSLVKDSPTDKARYFAIIEGGNISEGATMGYRRENNSVASFPIVIGQSIELPAGSHTPLVSPNGGTVDIAGIYLGDKPYSSDWVLNAEPRVQHNYYDNQNLNGFEDIYINDKGERSLRIYGDGSQKNIAIAIRKTKSGHLLSFRYKSTVSNLTTRTGHGTSPSGGTAGTLLSEIVAYPNRSHILEREFSADYDYTFLELRFTGTENDYIDISDIAITEKERLIDDKLEGQPIINDWGGIQEYPTVRKAILAGASGLVKVGRFLLEKTVENPVLKSDYNYIEGELPARSSKLRDISHVDLGDWNLKLITTDRKFIFTNWLSGAVKYTYNIEECLVNEAHPTESRFTFDDTKLTPMFTGLDRIVGIREMGDGELSIVSKVNGCRYTTDNQTVLSEVVPLPESVGNIIDGWSLDAYDDTVVCATYAAAGVQGYGQGSVILSTDFGRTMVEILNVEDQNVQDLLGVAAQEHCHIHGVFIDQYRETLVALIGDGLEQRGAAGEILILENYRENTEWRLLPTDLEHGITHEQYVTGIAMQRANLYGSDMHNTCIARQAFGLEGFDSPRESATEITIGLNWVYNFTRPVEPNAPIGIHKSYVGSAGGSGSSAIMLTKDGFSLPEVYVDEVSNPAFANNNSRVWCTVSGDVYATQFKGRFENELIIGKYNGYNKV